MPLRSQAQRRWMHATHPEMAKRWEAETPEGKLPEKVSQGFEFAELGPNAGERVGGQTFRWPPKLKQSEFDDTIFSGDPTRLMPHLRAIHKLGGISDSEVGIEDLDAMKTTGRHYARQAQREFSDRPVDAGPGYGADHDSKSTADGGNEPEGLGNLPLEEPEESTRSVMRRSVGGLRKQGAGVIIPSGFRRELEPGLPRQDTVSALEQRMMLAQAVQEALVRGGELRGHQEPIALALAGEHALEGAQYARLADEGASRANRLLAARALEKMSMAGQGWSPWMEAEALTGRVKLAEPPPPPGMSAKRWDKILEAGPKEGEETLPPILTKMEDKKPITEVTDLIQKLEKRGEEQKVGPVQRVGRGLGFAASVLAPGKLSQAGGRAAARDLQVALTGKEKKGYKLQGHTEHQGIPIAIENRKGSVRKGTDSDGNEWRTKMQHPYGYIKGTKGADDEPVDAYVGPDKEAPKAFVVHQHKDDGKGYDEDKVMLGFPSKKAAKEAYLAHYDSPKFLGPISAVPIERLRELIESKKRLVKISFAMPAVEDQGYQGKIRRRFDKLTDALKAHGDPIGTGHKRLIIPKRVMKEDDLIGQLGFVPVKVAIPEAGQTRFESFRHPDNLFHLHEHGDAWVMHKDEHPASTMLIKKWQMARDAAKKAVGEGKAEAEKAVKATSGILKPIGDFIKGLPHVVTEGIPGAYYYAKGRLSNAPGMRERLEGVTPKSYVRQVERWAELKKAAEAGLFSDFHKIGGLVEGDDDRQRLVQAVRKAGPGVGGALGAGIGALVGLKRGNVLKSTLTGLGTGATLGWTPDMYLNAREALRHYRSGQ